MNEVWCKGGCEDRECWSRETCGPRSRSLLCPRKSLGHKKAVVIDLVLHLSPQERMGCYRKLGTLKDILQMTRSYRSYLISSYFLPSDLLFTLSEPYLRYCICLLYNSINGTFHWNQRSHMSIRLLCPSNWILRPSTPWILIY